MTNFLSFSTKLKTTLEEIVSGHHNDANCKEFQEKYERRHGKAPQPCKFKDHPKQIPNLLEKIVSDESERSKLGFRKRLKNFYTRK